MFQRVRNIAPGKFSEIRRTQENTHQKHPDRAPQFLRLSNYTRIESDRCKDVVKKPEWRKTGTGST
jgi:hypothetical protein